MLANHVRGNGGEFGASLLDRGAGREASEKFSHAVNAALHHRGGKMMRAGDDVDDDLGIGRIGNRRLKDADDGCGARAETHGFSDDARVAVEGGLPESISENSGACGVRSVVAHVDEATLRGMQAHHVEIGAADDTGADFAGFAKADHGETDDGEIAEFADGLDAGFDVHNFGDREIGVVDADAHGGLADIDDAVFVAIIEWAKEDAADDAEDGGVGADAEREGDDDGDRESFAAPEGAGGEFEVGEEELGLHRSILLKDITVLRNTL